MIAATLPAPVRRQIEPASSWKGVLLIFKVSCHQRQADAGKQSMCCEEYASELSCFVPAVGMSFSPAVVAQQQSAPERQCRG
jgi:hypothetical protein